EPVQQGAGPAPLRGDVGDRGELVDGGVLEHVDHRDLDTGCPAQSRRYLGGEQRVATEVEEVVIDPDLRDAKQVAPDRGKCLLGWRAGSGGPVRGVRGGQRTVGKR